MRVAAIAVSPAGDAAGVEQIAAVGGWVEPIVAAVGTSVERPEVSAVRFDSVAAAAAVHAVAVVGKNAAARP